MSPAGVSAVLVGAVFVAMTALGVAWLLLGAWRAALEQARALEQGRLVESPEPWLPALRGVSRSLNATVRRLRDLFAAQAQQVAMLQQQAQLDTISGLPLRPVFLVHLQQRLADPGGAGIALLLVRVLQLDSLNPRLGHEGTDRVLGAIGDVLLTYVRRVPGTFAGRLNGSDFALCLPVMGVAQETAESLLTALAAAPALRAGGAEVAVGGADGLAHIDASAALAAADAALARAEIGAAAVPVVEVLGEGRGAEGAGASAWRQQIAHALAEGRVRLAEFPVVDRDGGIIHLECPLRLQLLPDGDYLAAERWLALARRSRLLPQVDRVAVDLALRAIAADGQPRAVHAAAASLDSAGFVADVARRLAESPQAAARLSIDCIEGLRPAESRAPLAVAVAAWKPFGVRVGIEHSGASPQRLPLLQATGIAYVKVDARHLRGAADDAAVRGYAQSLAGLIHGLGLSALAEGIEDPRDLAALWTLGYDGATGPAVAPAAPAPQDSPAAGDPASLSRAG